MEPSRLPTSPLPMSDSYHAAPPEPSPEPPPPAAAPPPPEAAPSFPLDGVLERQAYPPLLTLMAALVAGFVVYQLVGGIGFVVGLLLSGVAADELMTALTDEIGGHGRTMLAANAAGQVIGLGLLAVGFARLHTSRPAAFLRLRRPDAGLLGLSLLGLGALTPVVMWLGTLNEGLPLPQPEWLQQMEEGQLELIENVLMRDASAVFNLIMIALTPAVCEELLFRGYVQRQAERSLGVAGGIVLTGVLFGLFHLRLTQLLPLATLGCYLAWLTWRTRSLWPAVAVHLLNNGAAVLIAAYLADRPGSELDELETMSVPWYFVVAGGITFVLVLSALRRRARSLDLPTSTL